MQPIPETRSTLQALVLGGGPELAPWMDSWVQRAVAIVPELVGMSFSLVREGITLTYEATAPEVAGLDAVQYLDGGPCTHAIDDGGVFEANHDVFDEQQWLLFAQATAALGVRSTLSLPMLAGDAVTGGINLYGPAPDTFRGRSEALSAALGAWEPGAVHNADLSFQTRLDAVDSPRRLGERSVIDHAVGLVVARHRVDPETAQRRLEHAAAQAGVSLFALAILILEEHLPPEE